MDPQRMAQIDRWAEYIRTHPDWKIIHTRFINAQFDMAQKFWKRILAQPDGKRRLREIYKIKNPKALP